MKKNILFSLLALFLASDLQTGCTTNPDGSLWIDTSFISGKAENHAAQAGEKEHELDKPYYVSGNLVIEHAMVDDSYFFGNSGGFRRFWEKMPVRDGAMHYRLKNLRGETRYFIITNYWFRPGNKAYEETGADALENGRVKCLEKSRQEFSVGPGKETAVRIMIPKNLSGKVIYCGVLQ